MIPEFVDIGSVWDVLPPGIHDASLAEIEQRFATNEKRKLLYQGFKEAVESLESAGCKTVFLDGSFVSDKTYPGDFDACWEPVGVDTAKLDPILIDLADLRSGRKKQRMKYHGEFFPSNAKADGRRTFADYFQEDKDTKKAKGIIRIRFT